MQIAIDIAQRFDEKESKSSVASSSSTPTVQSVSLVEEKNIFSFTHQVVSSSENLIAQDNLANVLRTDKAFKRRVSYQVGKCVYQVKGIP